jgi:hypothetical protein
VFSENRCENNQILFSVLDSTKLVFNVLGLCEGGEIEAQMFNLVQMLIRIPNVQI